MFFFARKLKMLKDFFCLSQIVISHRCNQLLWCFQWINSNHYLALLAIGKKKKSQNCFFFARKLKKLKKNSITLVFSMNSSWICAVTSTCCLLVGRAFQVTIVGQMLSYLLVSSLEGSTSSHSVDSNICNTTGLAFLSKFSVFFFVFYRRNLHFCLFRAKFSVFRWTNCQNFVVKVKILVFKSTVFSF